MTASVDRASSEAADTAASAEVEDELEETPQWAADAPIVDRLKLARRVLVVSLTSLALAVTWLAVEGGIGLFDLLSTIKVSLNDPAWTGSGVEAYLFASLVYFVFCTAMSMYSRRFERRAISSS